MTLSRVTTPTGLTPDHQRRHRHAGAAHSEWRAVKQPVGPTGGLCAGHWRHLRTPNVVESPFAAVWLRTTAGKRYNG